MTLVNSGGTADYIVEEGTEGIWTCRKWASGILEAWGNQTLNTAMTTQIGGILYWGNVDISISSLNLITISSVSVVGHAAGYYFGTKVDAYSNTNITFSSIASAKQTTDVKYFINIKGLWKEFTPDIMKTPSLDLYYPVGSIYQTSNANFDPNVTFGGTWELITNKFLIGAGDEYENGVEGGEATHTLTINEMPSHNHGEKSLSGYLYAYAWGDGSSSGIVTKTTGAKNMTMSGGSTIGHIGYTVDATHTHNANGNGVAHNNLPPYKAVFMWERTA